MYHIPNDIRAKKSANLIIQGLYKSLEEKPLKDVKVNDIYNNSYVSRATFYRLFDSIRDILIYQCDLIVNEMLISMKEKQFESRKEAGAFCLKLWLRYDNLIKAIVENNLYGLLYEVILNHKDGLKVLYGVDYYNNPNADYFIYFLVALIYTSFVIFYKEKGKKPIEEILNDTNKILSNIMKSWEIEA